MYLLITDICAQKYISNSFGESYIFTYLLELQMKVREGFTITEKFPIYEHDNPEGLYDVSMMYGGYCI